MPSEQTPTRRKSRPLLIALGILLLLCSSVLLWIRHTKSNKENTTSAVVKVIHLETFVVNLGGTDQSAYLRLGVDVGVGAVDAERADEFSTAILRDTILNVITTQTAEQLLSEKGKSELKAVLLRALQQRLPSWNIREVYFTELLVQR